MNIFIFCNEIYYLSIILYDCVKKNNMWASHGLDRFCVRPYSKLGPEFQVTESRKRKLKAETEMGIKR
jgi:hypothetical protein